MNCHLKINKTLYSSLIKGNLHAFINSLDNLIKDNNTTNLERANRFISNPGHLRLLISQLLQQPEFLNKIVSESYYHENGFHKIVLLSGHHFKLRLHHFGNSVKPPMENVHDHRWPFASSILAGTLKMDLFEVNDDLGEEVIHYRYNSNKSKGSYSTLSLGRKFVKVVESKLYSSGDQYLMRPSDLHRITNKPGEESITLILTGNPVASVCNLFARREILEEEKKPIPYELHVLTSMLKNLIEKIDPKQN